MSSQDKVYKGQRKSVFCGHFMAEWDDHHYCPKCRDNLKGDDPCANSTDCTICSSFSDEQKRKISNRNRYKSKKGQNSSVVLDNGGKDGIVVDDSLLDEDEASVSFQIPSSQKNRSLEDKLDRFFNEFANISQRLQNLEQKDSETAGSHNSPVTFSRETFSSRKKISLRNRRVYGPLCTYAPLYCINTPTRIVF